EFRPQPAADSRPRFARASAPARGGRFAKVSRVGNLSAQIWHRSSSVGYEARRERPFKCRRQRCDDERENRIAAKLVARSPTALRRSLVRFLNALGPGRSRRLGKLNMRISHKTPHGHKSPFSSAFAPAERVLVTSRESLELRTGTV